MKEARAAPLVVSESTKSKKYTHIYIQSRTVIIGARGFGQLHCTALHWHWPEPEVSAVRHLEDTKQAEHTLGCSCRM